MKTFSKLGTKENILKIIKIYENALTNIIMKKQMILPLNQERGKDVITSFNIWLFAVSMQKSKYFWYIVFVPCNLAKLTCFNSLFLKILYIFYLTLYIFYSHCTSRQFYFCMEESDFIFFFFNVYWQLIPSLLLCPHIWASL